MGADRYPLTSAGFRRYLHDRGIAPRVAEQMERRFRHRLDGGWSGHFRERFATLACNVIALVALVAVMAWAAVFVKVLTGK